MTDETGKLDRLVAADEIRNLKCRYFRFVDTHDWDALAALFCREASFDTRRVEEGAAGPAQIGQLCEGRAAILNYIREGMAGSISFHGCQGHEIVVDSPVEAHGVVAMEDRVIWGSPPAASMHGFGHYHEQYRFEEGAWRIWRSRLVRLPLTQGPDVSPPAR